MSAGTVFKQTELIGRLATDNEAYPVTGSRGAVFINSQNEIQYVIKLLSVKSDITTDLFTGYMNSIVNLEFIDDQYAIADDERTRKFINFYSGKLFIFTPKQDFAGYWKIANAEIVMSSKDIDPADAYRAIPYFTSKEECNAVKDYRNTDISLYREYKNYPEFKSILLEGGDIGRIYNLPDFSISGFPEFIVWKDSDIMKAVGPVKFLDKTTFGTLKLQLQKDYFEFDLENEQDDTIEYILQGKNTTLIHFPQSRYLKIINTEVEKTAIGKKSISVSTFPPVEISSSTSNLDHAEPESFSEGYKELPTEKTDQTIIEFFKYHSQGQNLYYNLKDLMNFHTAIKTGNLVILSGMSGTGKSALVDMYAKALGSEVRTLFIPVRPSWNDDSDLLGYVDLIHMVYRPSDTGFIKIIAEASREENKDKIYLICLDEMNLARVEHYFSQFLSILEKPIGNRNLVLYDEQYAGQLYNAASYPQQISLTDNIKFIGTVNIDESTYHFSDKVLDRANVITLDILDYSKPANWKPEKYRATNTPVWYNEDFKKLIQKDNMQFPEQEKIRNFLWELHCLLNSSNANLGIGPRIVKSVENYLRNIPVYDGEISFSINDGIDFQIAQRVLTKIRGPEEQIGELIVSSSTQKSTIEVILDKYSDVSEFTRSKKLICKKKKELDVYGYCL